MGSAATTPFWFLENIAVKGIIAGIDEAGRGALAGPVVAAAVILDANLSDSLFYDSKQLTDKRRRELYSMILGSNSCVGLGIHSHREIDRINILQATLSAMTRACNRLRLIPTQVVIDGNRIPSGLKIPARAVVKGDQLIPAVSAASIVAKVVRDNIMIALDSRFPEYGFGIHKGYGTASHYESLRRFGPTNVHRSTFNLSVQERLF